MRIISGTMRGTKLYTLEGDNTRPTLDRVKEALFSKINFEIQDAIILDLFSGSGALGLESISRGAKQAYLCDNSKIAIKIINQNIEKTKTKNQVVLMPMDYQVALEEFKKSKKVFDIIFLDPPYKTDYAEIASKIIIENKILKQGGFIVLETDDKEKVLNNLDTSILDIREIKKYGRVYLIFIYSK